MTKTSAARATRKLPVKRAENPATAADVRRIIDRQTNHLLAIFSAPKNTEAPVRGSYPELAIGAKVPRGIFAGITYSDGKPYVGMNMDVSDPRALSHLNRNSCASHPGDTQPDAGRARAGKPS